MEILKRGALPEDHVFDLTCVRCQTEFRFARSEGQVSREGDCVLVNCPICLNRCTSSLKNGRPPAPQPNFHPSHFPSKPYGARNIGPLPFLDARHADHGPIYGK